MKREKNQRQDLLAATIEAVAFHGLGDFSLRHLARMAGTSTTAVFQNFSGKAELLENALALALARDSAFHEALLEQARLVLSTHTGFADFLARYIQLRPPLVHARFLSEILIRLEDYPQFSGLMAEWLASRAEFWTAILSGLEAAPGLAAVVAQFAQMEEYYAFALKDECTYGMLLAEICRAVCDAAFHAGVSRLARSHVSLSLNTQPMAIHAAETATGSPVPEQMLTAALQIIEHAGLDALNQRRLARDVGVSTSAIAYYFKDMKGFRNTAIWRALISGIPGQLDPERPTTIQPRDLGQWLATLDTLLEPGTDGTPPGFYVGFSRLTAQACLLSCNDPSLVPLISYLRALEGWGTYRVSRNIPSVSRLIGREHAAAFGMWIKAEAVFRQVNLALPGTGIERLSFAARIIFPAREPA